MIGEDREAVRELLHRVVAAAGPQVIRDRARTVGLLRDAARNRYRPLIDMLVRALDYGIPASLAGAIRLRQLAAAAGTEIAVMVIEKGGEIGNHGFSGAVVETSLSSYPGTFFTSAPSGAQGVARYWPTTVSAAAVAPRIECDGEPVAAAASS